MPRRLARTFFVYLMGSRSGVLYTGMTNDLARRVYEHRGSEVPGFTARYAVTRLLYFEEYDRPLDAIRREKEIKGWVRRKKLALIRSQNPRFEDLAATLMA